MARTVQGPKIDETEQTHPISKGGTSSLTLEGASKKLNLATRDMVGQPEGLIGLDANGKIPLSLFPADNRVNLEGSLNVVSLQTLVFEISDFDSFKTYNISASAGSVTRNGSTVTFTAPNSLGNVNLTINGKVYVIDVQLAAPVKPAMLAPVNNSNILTSTYALSSSAFSPFGDSSTHQSSDWQVANDSGFTNILTNIVDSAINKTTYTVSGLVDTNTYYARVRYKGSNGNYSQWSDAVSFTLSIPVPAAPSITYPTANLIDVSPSPNITTSAFVAMADASTHASTDWQVATDAAFTNLVKNNLADTVNKTSYVANNLAIISDHYVRARYRSSNGKVSSWSSAIKFTTVNAFVLTRTISADVNNYNMKTQAIAGGWDQVMPLHMTVTVNAGFVVGSASTATAAFSTGSGYPGGSQLNLVNNGYIVGRGGEGGRGGGDGGGGGGGTAGYAGGPALESPYPLTITNNGTIGGGGGGGGGAAPFTFGVISRSTGQISGYRGVCGGGGGGGAGRVAGSPGRDGDGDGTWLDVNGGSTFTAGSGALTTGGGGGAGQYSNYGGAGGALGQPGVQSNGGSIGANPAGEDNDGNTAGGPSAINAGGAAGFSAVNNANNTWLSLGTRLGPVSQ